MSFNDTAWSSGLGGFGKGTVSGVTLNTTFATTVQNYLLRKDIESSSIASTGLVIETSILGGAEIYINGVLCYSYNMFYPVTETSTALDDAAVVPTIYTEGYQQVIRIPKDYFNLVGTNQIAVLLKNTTIAYSKMHFEMQLHDYTFPSVGVFGNQTFQSTGFGDGVWTMIPYLPKNAEQYSIIQDNVEYFIITSGQKDGTSSVSTPSGQGINSQSADWLKGALAISMANTDIDLRCLMIHQGPVSWVQGSKNKPFHNYIFEDSYFNTKIDFLLVGDSHVSEAFEHSPSEIKVFNASNHKGNSTDIPTSYKQANIYDQTGDTNMGSSTSGTWSTLFYDQTPLNNLFIEITTNPSGVVTLEYIDKDGVVNHTEQLFPKP